MFKKNCRNCNGEFIGAFRNTAYCSQECKVAKLIEKSIKLTCCECQQEFYVEWQCRTIRRRFCSRRCHGINFQRRFPGKPLMPYPKTCGHCQKEFVVYRTSRRDRKFCSQQCYWREKGFGYYVNDGNKLCPYCNKVKPLEAFYTNKRNASKRMAKCKSCHKEYQANLVKGKGIDAARNKKRRRERALLKEYGISWTEYESLLFSQDHRCKICREVFDENGKTPSVDHCHKTGLVRGLLCQLCNSGLGMFKDHVKNLANAALYLQITSEQ